MSTRPVPTPAEAKAHGTPRMIRRACLAAKRHGRPFYVVPTAYGPAIDHIAPRPGDYSRHYTCTPTGYQLVD